MCVFLKLLQMYQLVLLHSSFLYCLHFYTYCVW